MSNYPLRLPDHVMGSCPTAWCSFAGMAMAISGKAGLIKLPWKAA